VTRSRIRIISGVGRFRDPWHPFADTSPRIAALLGERDHQVEIRESTPEAFGGLDDVDLVVLNIGGGEGEAAAGEADASTWQRTFDSFGQWIRAGHPIIGIHCAANAFPDWPDWEELLGGLWIRGTSHHPPRTEFTFEVVPAHRTHPAVGGLSTITALDERYSELDVAAGSIPLVQHRFDDKDQIMVWAVDDGHRKAVYDGLGHNLESYDSPERCRLLIAETDWLLDHPEGAEAAS
jgi:type 1 glutamine amidotransferase